MGSAVLLRSKATSRQRKSSSLIRSASPPSTSPKCRPPRESSTSSWRSTELRSSPSSNLPKKPIVLPHRPSWSPWSKPFPTKSIRCSPIGHPVPFATATRKCAERAIYDAHVRSALPRARYRTPIHQDQSSLDQRPGRTNEPHDQGRNRQTLSLRRSRPVAPPSRRLRRRLQFRTPSEDPQRPHAIRVRLKMLEFRTRPIQTQPTPTNAGTEQLTLTEGRVPFTPFVRPGRALNAARLSNSRPLGRVPGSWSGDDSLIKGWSNSKNAATQQ